MLNLFSELLLQVTLPVISEFTSSFEKIRKSKFNSNLGLLWCNGLLTLHKPRFELNLLSLKYSQEDVNSEITSEVLGISHLLDIQECVAK